MLGLGQAVPACLVYMVQGLNHSLVHAKQALYQLSYISSLSFVEQHLHLTQCG